MAKRTKSENTQKRAPKEEAPGKDEPKKLGAFDFVNSILKTKVDLITEADDPVAAEKVYNPFITNLALSQHIDTIMFANDMNGAHWLQPKLQYAYHLNSARSMNRRFAWAKKAKDEDLETVMAYYKVSAARAKEHLAVLTSENLEEIRKRINTGGKVK